jgi:hypothetical protein
MRPPWHVGGRVKCLKTNVNVQFNKDKSWTEEEVFLLSSISEARIKRAISFSIMLGRNAMCVLRDCEDVFNYSADHPE